MSFTGRILQPVVSGVLFDTGRGVSLLRGSAVNFVIVRGRVHMLRRVAQSGRSILLLSRHNNYSRFKTIGTRDNRDFSTQNTKMGDQREQDDAFEKMEQEGIPKCPEPTKVATEPKSEELPKLSPQEFRQWNHMSEHMDMFVRTHFYSLRVQSSTNIYYAARKLPPHLEHALRRRLL